MYGRFDDESLTVRGFEASVPALNALRAACWPRLAVRWRCLLEIADYVGLERLVVLTVEEFRSLGPSMPSELFAYGNKLTDNRAGPLPAFQDDVGEPLSLAAIIQAVSSAFQVAS